MMAAHVNISTSDLVHFVNRQPRANTTDWFGDNGRIYCSRGCAHRTGAEPIAPVTPEEFSNAEATFYRPGETCPSCGKVFWSLS